MGNGARRVAFWAAVVTLGSTLITAGTVSAQPGDGPAGAGWDRGREVSETTRLADRRTLVSGDRMYAAGDASGLYPAAGWHIRGEMGGFWTPPVKLLDAVGAVLPRGTSVGSVLLNGAQAPFDLVTTARGTEVRVPAGVAADASLMVVLR